MTTSAARAYLALAADERLETRIPGRLKRDAEAIARARGSSLSEYVIELLAERVADEIVVTPEWVLTPEEQKALLQVLAAAPIPTSALTAATERATALFGAEPAA